MNNTPINDLYFSTCLFVEHQILQKGAAFENNSSLFYQVSDPELPNLNIYSAPYKQIVADTSISGAAIPTGVYVNNILCGRGVSGLIAVDFLNNRAIFSGGSQFQGLNVSGSYAIKNFNFYPVTKSVEELIYETKFELNPSYYKNLTGISKNSDTIPGIFVSCSNFDNETYSFGGLVETSINVKFLIIAESVTDLTAVGNLLIDEKYSSFPITDKIPLNYYGDYKSGVTYNYLEYVAPTGQNLGYIADADFYKLSNRDFNNRYPDLRCGFVDMEIKAVRFSNRLIT